MSVIAVYSMKGGVGKTTTAVNLAWLAAAEGRRVLLWDLDPQAASSFAFRVHPRVPGFGRRSLESGRTLAAAIRASDYDNLDLLPADFSYRKLDRLIEQLGDPARVMGAVLGALGRDYDLVLLDCPAGFSLLNEGVLACADAVLAPTLPSVLSLRTIARLLQWADRTNAGFELAAFLSMVDRRKALHRHVCDWRTTHPDVFMRSVVPYASLVEEMTVRRAPLPVFAPREAATLAFGEVWNELQARLRQAPGRGRPRDRWARPLKAVTSLVGRLETLRSQASGRSRALPSGAGRAQFVHRFDTSVLDLERHGIVVELRECPGRLVVVVESAGDGSPDRPAGDAVAVVIDSARAVQVLSGALSPLAVLEGTPGASVLLPHLLGILDGRPLQLMESRVGK